MRMLTIVFALAMVLLKINYILFLWSVKKLSYPDLKITAEKLNARYKPKFILIEDKASGQSLIQDLKNDGFSNIVPTKPKLDKVTRFAAIIPQFQSGQILLPLKSSFNRVMLKELTSFPASKNDDIVDSFSQMVEFFKNQKTKHKARVRLL